MTGMIERVALAIVERRHGKGAHVHGENLADARAAIKAMQPEFRAAYDLGQADAAAARALLDATYSYPATSDPAVLTAKPAVGTETRDED